MTTFSLKILAVISMTLDHVGMLFFPQSILLRAVGRLAFPIFAFLTAESCRKTHDPDAYIQRLLCWGIISEIPFDLFCFGTIFSPTGQNIFFTLFLGSLAIRLWQLQGNRRFFSLLPLVAADMFAVDYGFLGVATIVLLFLALERQEPVSAGGILVINCILFSVIYGWPVQLAGIAALVPLHFYNGRRGRSWKRFFYSFYPVHLLLLWLIFQILS